MQQLHSTRRDNERQPTTMRGSEENVESSWNRRESASQSATIANSERHAATPWHWKRQPAAIIDR